MKHNKRRLIAAAMSAFTILLVLIIGGMVLMSYVQMEQDATRFVRQMLEDGQPFSQPAAPPMFGYQPEARMAPAGFYDITVDADGLILRQEAHGVSSPDSLDVQQTVDTILARGSAQGKVGIYKYGVAFQESGTHIILLDNAIQIQALYAMLRSAALVGALCLLLMFIILQPIASRAAKASVAAQEREQQFITNASHEMKTPVAVIQSNIEAMELISGETKWSRNIRRQTQQLSHMIVQLLLLERMNEQALRERPAPVDIVPLIRTVHDDMQPLLSQHALTLVLHMPDALSVRGHVQPLEQLVRILLDNAARYAEAGTAVHLTLTAQRRCAVLRCTNAVTSLPSCPPEHLFERFHRGGMPRQAGDTGCGIGLSAAASIAAMHNGRIEAAYPDAHTFQITLTLPAA